MRGSGVCIVFGGLLRWRAGRVAKSREVISDASLRKAFVGVGPPGSQWALLNINFVFHVHGVILHRINRDVPTVTQKTKEIDK